MQYTHTHIVTLSGCPVITSPNTSCDANVHPSPPSIIALVACVYTCLYYMQVSAGLVQRFCYSAVPRQRYKISELANAVMSGVASP